jgi:hypothetical protein
MPRIKQGIVQIVLNKDEDLENYKIFQKKVADNGSDVTKTTKKLWFNYGRGE